jgi:hypothetical protein
MILKENIVEDERHLLRMNYELSLMDSWSG